ncbi:endoribonuclease [Vibrio cholerae]|uniref:endoribonuclease n=1 Tax=Vibrio cholerae TaxID=666 RepID=UPI000BA9BB65|nr:endoribonuclease [Vibrio cholerae]PAS01616.1 endoribonuclease [Vibrio cholerae]
MIAKSYIEGNLKQLNRLYNDAGTQKKELYYSKLAMLELCGWIEESMDDIAIRCANRILKEGENKTFVKNNVVKPIYGFEYKVHFRKMLMQIIGLVNMEKLERSVDPRKYAQLTSTLGALKVSRNNEAHTHIKGVARTIDAPSVTLHRFYLVYEGLKDFEAELKAMNM